MKQDIDDVVFIGVLLALVAIGVLFVLVAALWYSWWLVNV